MMHPNFYHWHTRAELKPDTTKLEARWNAAAEFVGDASGADTCSLLRIALFPSVDLEFAQRFSGALVKLEPTFPPERNAELLRVMASAALYNQMETESSEGDAVALGLLAATFPAKRIKPVSKELLQRASEYLASESERVRPMPSLEGKFRALKKAFKAEDWRQNPEATQILGDAVLELGETMGRISEENQFLWWLLGRSSPSLNIRRDKLTAKDYALAAAAEAAQRVALLPPPASAESLIIEVLAHCKGGSNSPVPLVDFVNDLNPEWAKTRDGGGSAGSLVALASLVAIRGAGGNVDRTALKSIDVSVSFKVSPSEVACQYFRELMFLRAIRNLS